MPSHFVALSDLHLGYDNAILNDPGCQEKLASEIARLTGGQTDRLILNGDAFEACVPKDAGVYDPRGYSPYMADCSRRFFNALTGYMSIESLILVWGNHDFAMWKKLAKSCGVGTFTNGTKGDVLLQNNACDLPGASAFLDDVIGHRRAKFKRIRSAYPNYVIGRSWPYLTFHHGHFLDDLIIGQDNEAAYIGLRALTGVGRPAVNINDDETVKAIHDKTDAFVDATWAFNSKARKLQWAMIRRFEDHPRCGYFPTDPAPASRKVLEDEPFHQSLGKNATWYANVLMADPTTPAPLGGGKDPSYLFLGHDHQGGFQNVKGMDGMTWKLVNTGGWTHDGGSPEIHGHVVIWPKEENAPLIHCVRV
jgi:hypothetical protein